MTRKGVWNLQQVRDKYLQELWENKPGLFALAGGGDGVMGAVAPAYDRSIQYSSPAQIPGTTWSETMPSSAHYAKYMIHTKTDGTMWAWGYNVQGGLGINENENVASRRSSPTQVPGTTWPTTNLWEKLHISNNASYAIKTDGTLWSWGNNYKGNLGLNNASPAQYSSPTQVGGGTDWKSVTRGGGIKTDGTLWVWGSNSDGGSGINLDRSSPVQVPGTTWAQIIKGNNAGMATKTDGTLWSWGQNTHGNLGLNNTTNTPSITQIPGTNWSTAAGAISTNPNGAAGAIKQDGTLWVWGNNNYGALGQNNLTRYSSPVQIPGTTWSTITTDYNNHMRLLKTDGTAWGIGYNSNGMLGQNNRTPYSSPVQIPGNWKSFGGGLNYAAGVKTSLTPSQL